MSPNTLYTKFAFCSILGIYTNFCIFIYSSLPLSNYLKEFLFFVYPQYFTWVCISIVFELLCPCSSWIYLKSTPLSNNCVQLVIKLVQVVNEIKGHSCPISSALSVNSEVNLTLFKKENLCNLVVLISRMPIFPPFLNL